MMRFFAQAMSKGSQISWLSVYPKEDEILYPPLTYLTPRSSEGSCAWVERLEDEEYLTELTDTNKNKDGRDFTILEIEPCYS